MAVQDDYIEALNDCIERLAAGESMDAILRDYPTMAQDLRPMLEAGNLIRRVRYPAIEVNTTQIRVAPKVQEAARKSFGGSSRGGFNFWPVLLVAVALGLIAGVWQTGNDGASPTEESDPASVIEENLTSPEETPIFVEATEAIPEATAPSVQASPMPEETVVAAEITESAAEGTQSPALITIEGAVEAINANVITIFDIEIVLAPDDPALTVIQVGDVIRVEGEYEGSDTLVFVAVTIIFVDVDVFVNEGEVWRDSGNCSNPPPAWAPANGWRRRCESRGGNNGGGGGRGGSS